MAIALLLGTMAIARLQEATVALVEVHVPQAATAVSAEVADLTLVDTAAMVEAHSLVDTAATVEAHTEVHTLAEAHTSVVADKLKFKHTNFCIGHSLNFAH